MGKKNNSAKKTEKAAGQQISIKRFAVTYIVMMSAFFLLIGLKPVQDIIDLNGLYTTWVISLTSKVLGLINIKCAYQGSVIHLPSISLDVKFGCNGLEAVMIYSIAVITFPSALMRKIIGIVAGFSVIQVINILRIAGLAYSGMYFRELFEYIHIYVAQGMMIAVSLGVFFIYLSYAKSPKTAAL